MKQNTIKLILFYFLFIELFKKFNCRTIEHLNYII